MSLPTFEINVLGCRFMAREAEPGEIPDDSVGSVNVEAGLILMKRGLSYDEARETLLHELIHAVDIKTAGGRQLSERRVSRISACLFQVLASNPEAAFFIVMGAEFEDAEGDDEKE